jgi:REP element-mobilizing transposase RayT
MPRTKRRKSRTGIYHILLRGINKQHIFEDASDYRVFLDLLAKTKELSAFSLYAYCLMGNHVHLIIKEGQEPLSQIFKRLGASYAYRYNKKYERSGHLFQDRFKSEPVESDEYFMTVLTYLYQNPVKAGICENAGEYEWSSFRLIGREDSFIDETELFTIVSKTGIKKGMRHLLEREFFAAEKKGRKARYSDEDASLVVREICGASTVSQFQRLNRGKQRDAVMNLRTRGMPIRQLARVTGLGKGIVERWAKDTSE